MTVKELTREEARALIFKNYSEADDSFLNTLIHYWGHGEGSKKNKTKKNFVEALNDLRSYNDERSKNAFSEGVLHCPKCGAIHLDEGEWAKRLHHKHLCLYCNHIWKLDSYVFGISVEERERSGEV